MNSKTRMLLLLSTAFLPPAFRLEAAPPSDRYVLVWSDEFNGTKLDLSKWGYRQLGKRRDAYNVKDTVRLDGKGNLELITRKVGDRYHTAMIGTQGKFETRFGYFECRMRFQKQVGHWSAFWLQSPRYGPVGDPAKYGAEIDVIEYLAKTPELVRINIHWDGYGKHHKHVGATHIKKGLNKGFHLVGFEWKPDRYLFYIDGEKVWETTKGISRRRQYIILSLEVGKWAGDIAKARLPDGILVDYVRVYKPKAEWKKPRGKKQK